MHKKIIKFIIGLLTIPVCIGVSLSLYEHLSKIKVISYYQQKAFIIGIIGYLVVHAAVFKPSYLYVLSHELMHSIATLLSGGRVMSIKVSSDGGSVRATKSNIFIALSPYLVPFYTVIVLLAWFAVKFFTKIEPNYSLFLFVTGFTLAFHIVLTIDFLKIKQTDLMHMGYFFSICFIYIINLIIIGFMFSILFKGVDFRQFLQGSYVKSGNIYIGIFRQLFL